MLTRRFRPAAHILSVPDLSKGSAYPKRQERTYSWPERRLMRSGHNLMYDCGFEASGNVFRPQRSCGSQTVREVVGELRRDCD